MAPLQGLAGCGPGLSFILAGGICSTLGCTSSPDEDREEWAERLAEFPGVPGVPEVPGAWTAGSEELLGTAGGSRSSPPPIWLELSDARLSTLRAGDGVAEGGSECERREAWRACGVTLGTRGAGRFFVLGLLVGVMPYQGCRDLGVHSGGAWAGLGAELGATGDGSSGSSSFSKGL